MIWEAGPGLVLSLAGGVAAGWVCFAGLWGTVRGFADARRPVVAYVVSLAVRMPVVLAALILSARAGVENLLLCLLGVVVARFCLQARFRKS